MVQVTDSANSSPPSEEAETCFTSPAPPQCDNVHETSSTEAVEPVELASPSVIEDLCAATPCRENGNESLLSPESTTESSWCSSCSKLKEDKRRLQKQVSKLKGKYRKLKKAKRAIQTVSRFFLFGANVLKFLRRIRIQSLAGRVYFDVCLFIRGLL